MSECRTDGRCQYAIDHGAEGMGACPKGKCVMPMEQPEQEPVAWSYWQSCLNDDGTQTAPWVHRVEKFKPSESIINKNIVPLYTSPPKRKPLTDDELKPLIQQAMMYYGYKQENWIHTSGAGFYQLARAIEAAHGIKGEA